MLFRSAIPGAEGHHPAVDHVAPDAGHPGPAELAFGRGAEDRFGVGAATGTEEGDAHGGKVSPPARSCNRFFEFGL